MKILIISNSNPSINAGIVAKDILDGLRSKSDNRVKLLVRAYDIYSDKDIESIDSFLQHYSKWLIRKALRMLVKLKLVNESKNTIDSNYHIQDYDQTVTNYTTKKILKKIDFKPNLIIVLFMQNFLSFKNLYELNEKTKAPILLYMMDMAPMTGGCHYAWDCNGYKNECGCCPALYSNSQNDQSRFNYEFKKKYIEKTNLVPIVGSSWQLKQLKESSLITNLLPYKLLLPINDTQYKPENKLKVRQDMGLPIDKKIIFFGATAFSYRRKGLTELLKSLTILKSMNSNTSNIHLAISGKNVSEFEKWLPFPYSVLGYLKHSELPKAFQAADVFVSPSIEDSGPMMVNQSIMCGTPVVAFKMGVAVDLVISGKTGYLAELNNCDDMAKGINDLLMLDNSKSKKIGENCRSLAINLITKQTFISNLESIINKL